MKIVIHLGVHKTASTFLQTHLQRNRLWLKEQGVLYIGPDRVRRALIPVIDEAMADGGTAAAAVAMRKLRNRIAHIVDVESAGQPEPQRLLISDEELLGLNGLIPASDRLYPQAAARVALLGQALQGFDITFCFGIRNYADFLVSSYCESLRHTKTQPFEAVLKQSQRVQFSWPGLISELRAGNGGSRILFWRYEDFPGSEACIFEALTGLDMPGIEDMAGVRVRPSLPAKGVAILQQVRNILTWEEFWKLSAYLAEKFEFEDDGGKLRFPDAQAEQALRQKYSSDIDRLMLQSRSSGGIIRETADAPDATPEESDHQARRSVA